MNYFAQVNFEHSDAIDEKIHSPGLINNTFININNVIEESLKSKNYIIHGLKGSGKTALAYKIESMSEEKWGFFCEVEDLENFDFKLIKKTGGESGQFIGSYTDVWKLLLYIRMFYLLSKNEDVMDSKYPVSKLIEDLQKHGLFSSRSLEKLVQVTSRRGLYVKFKNTLGVLQIGGDFDSQKVQKDPAELVEAIEEVLRSLPEFDSQSIIFLDGLDYVFKKNAPYASYLSDLITAVRNVNNFFISNGLNAKYTILFRDEIISYIPNPNLNKRLTDNGISLDWYKSPGNPFATELLKVIEARIAYAGCKSYIKDLWYEWFPSYINNVPSINFILNRTRFIPRDLIIFFHKLQELKLYPPFNEQDIFDALSNYSSWFLGELMDSLVGLIDEDLRRNLPIILSDMNPVFTYDEFKTMLQKHEVDTKTNDPNLILQNLFNTSWIGNFFYKYNKARYAFAYRKSYFSTQKNIIIHLGLRKVLNLT